jgi:hypothetical protein
VRTWCSSLEHARDRGERFAERCAARDELQHLGLVRSILLGMATGGDVARGDQNAPHHRIGTQIRRGGLDPAVRAVLVPNAMLDGLGLTRDEELL